MAQKPFNPELDVEIESIGDIDGSNIHVGLYSYNGGEHRVGITRSGVSERTGQPWTSAVGRMTVTEAQGLALLLGGSPVVGYPSRQQAPQPAPVAARPPNDVPRFTAPRPVYAPPGQPSVSEAKAMRAEQALSEAVRQGDGGPKRFVPPPPRMPPRVIRRGS